MVLGQRKNVKYKMPGKLVTVCFWAGIESGLSTQPEATGTQRRGTVGPWFPV